MRHRLIRVKRFGAVARVFVDDQELDVTDPVIVAVHPDEVPTVTVTLQADRIEVTDDVKTQESP